MTAISDYDSYDALGLAELVRNGEVSAGELLDEAISRVEATNPLINAFTVRFHDMARAAIAAGLPEGPLSGVPFPLKDLGAAMKGTPLTNGSKLFEHYVCDTTSTLVERFQAAGLVMFARTNSPEFGLSYATEPSLHGPTRNPWNLDHIPGGSSGGAAAAAAARVVPMAHASDGGGSIRVPASCCGLFGLKPARGRTPSGPTESDGWAGMTIGHAVTRSVRDSAALLDAISGPEPGDPYAAPAPARPFLQEVGADPGQLRIAFSGRPPSELTVHPDCIAAMEGAARLCADLGHHVEEAEPDYDRDLIDPARFDIIASYCRADTDEYAALFDVEPGALLEPSTMAFRRHGRRHQRRPFCRRPQDHAPGDPTDRPILRGLRRADYAATGPAAPEDRRAQPGARRHGDLYGDDLRLLRLPRPVQRHRLSGDVHAAPLERRQPAHRHPVHRPLRRRGHPAAPRRPDRTGPALGP